MKFKVLYYALAVLGIALLGISRAYRRDPGDDPWWLYAAALIFLPIAVLIERTYKRRTKD